MKERKFNTAGPGNPDQHYCIDPLSRVDWPEIWHTTKTVDGRTIGVWGA